MVSRSLRALLSQSIDYAGLFPPCNLALEPALKNHAGYTRLPDAWMLNSFVLPIGQFAAAKQFLSEFDPDHPLHISALGPKTDDISSFRTALTKAAAAIRSFSAHNVDLISVKQLEMPIIAAVDSDLLREAQSIVKDLPVFWEAPSQMADRVISLLAKHNDEVGEPAFGFKLRTGGVTADAFPNTAQIARALVAPAKHQLPVKFTAGLHHPIRQFRDEVKAKMHGFLNVMGAAVLGAEHRWDEQQTALMLADESAAAFSFDDHGFSWDEWRIETKRIQDRRRFVTSFGSCSFDEPREDLRALNLL